MKSAMQVFRDYVRKNGLRNTPEREVIIEEILATHDHFDVEELYLRLQRKQKKVSKPSIYRLIPHLLEAGLVQEAYFEDGHLHYEHIFGHKHHCHLRCLQCGTTIDFRDESIKRIEERLARQHHFAVEGHRLEVYGLCRRCKAK